MSYILDALRRAEQERQPRQSELRIVTDASGTHIAHQKPRWPLLVAALGGAFALGALLMIPFLRKPSEMPVPVTAGTPSAPAAAAPQVTALPPAQVLDDLVDPEAPADEEENAGLAGFPSAPEGRYAQSTPAQEPQESVTAAQEPVPAEVQRIELAPSPVPSVPQLKEMSADYRAGFPQISIDVHVYDADPGQRFVMINGRRYREGDVLSEGPQLIEITESGLVLIHGGQRVALSAMH